MHMWASNGESLTPAAAYHTDLSVALFFYVAKDIYCLIFNTSCGEAIMRLRKLDVRGRTFPWN
jgi:hypothetical protein